MQVLADLGIRTLDAPGHREQPGEFSETSRGAQRRAGWARAGSRVKPWLHPATARAAERRQLSLLCRLPQPFPPSQSGCDSLQPLLPFTFTQHPEGEELPPPFPSPAPGPAVSESGSRSGIPFVSCVSWGRGERSPWRPLTHPCHTPRIWEAASARGHRNHLLNKLLSLAFLNSHALTAKPTHRAERDPKASPRPKTSLGAR